jgi:hypothetical protein
MAVVLQVGDHHCEHSSFDEVMWLIKAHSGKSVPLVFQRDASSTVLLGTSAAQQRGAVEPDSPRYDV